MNDRGDRLESLGLRRSFGTVRQRKSGQGGFWIDFRPYCYLHSDRGRRFKTRAAAESLADLVVTRVFDGERAIDVLASYRRGIAKSPAAVHGQEAWKQDYKRRMLVSAKRRAEQKGIPFSIGIEDIWIPGVCPVLRIPLRPSEPGAGKNDNAPSLDRIIPSLGYVAGNVIVISWRANHLKRDATPEELRLVAEWLAYVDELPPRVILAGSGVAQEDDARNRP